MEHYHRPGLQYAWFEYSEPGEPTEKGTAALAFSSRLKWDIAYRTKLTLEYRGQYTSREVGETTHHGISTLSFELTKRFDLDVSFIWDRISNSRGGAWTTFNPSRTTFASSSGWAWIFKR